MYQEAALIALTMVSGAQESAHNKKPTLFTTKSVKFLCEWAIMRGLEVPFEVVGHKKLFALMLNQACLDDDLAEIVQSRCQAIFPKTVQNKLQATIHKTLQEASKKIKEAGLESQIAWRKSNYMYNFDLSLWDKTLGVPEFVKAKVTQYVEHLDLEKDFEESDLKLYYYN
jgi:hypothetical protein